MGLAHDGDDRNSRSCSDGFRLEMRKQRFLVFVRYRSDDFDKLGSVLGLVFIGYALFFFLVRFGVVFFFFFSIFQLFRPSQTFLIPPKSTILPDL